MGKDFHTVPVKLSGDFIVDSFKEPAPLPIESINMKWNLRISNNHMETTTNYVCGK